MKPTASATSLVWLRTPDLRLADNPALAAAAKAGAVVPVFIWDEPQAWPLGAASKWWLHQSLDRLQASLHQAGSKLILRQGAAARILLDLSRDTGATAVYWNRRYEPAWLAIDHAAKRALEAAGIRIETFAGNVLFEPGAILNQTGQPYRVFTPFAKAAALHSVPKALPEPTLQAPANWPKSLELSALRLEPAIDWAAGMREAWLPGEAGATRLLRRFARHAADYQATRDLPAQSGTSQLSPHLAFGELSARQAWHAIPEGPYRRQLLWREFAYHLLVHFPATPDAPLHPRFARFPWQMDARLYRAWRRGQTGYPIVDAGMRQLWHTGWMHNRVRLIVGSFLVKDLLISWQEGAHWFWDTLVDADLANNTLNWQWVAGSGADAAPYFRVFNPVTQGEKFDPSGAYIRRWVPELAGVPQRWIHKPWESPAKISAYPQPVVNHGEARLRALAALAASRMI